MKYDVKIIQSLEGCVRIEANSKEEALQIADKRYNRDGSELPDMDDVKDLDFEAIPKPCRWHHHIENCLCNNVPDDPGDCIYEDGIYHGGDECKYYE